MLQNTYFLAKIGADTAENEQHFAEILPKIGNYPTGRLTELRHAAVVDRHAVSALFLNHLRCLWRHAAQDTPGGT